MHKFAVAFAVILNSLVFTAGAFAHDASTPNLTMADCMRLLKGQGKAAGSPNANQRHMTNALELLRLQPKQSTNVHFTDATDTFKDLSRANLDRLLKQLRYEPRGKLTREELERIEQLASSFETVAMSRFSKGQEGPILPTADFYSYLTGGFKTVGHKLHATPEPLNIQSFRGQVLHDSARPYVEFVREFGVVLPEFSNPLALLEFFARWEPDAIDEVIRLNRYNLPNSVRTQEQFFAYIKSHAREVFPDAAAENRLAPLRERLHKYVMTPRDADVFFRHCIWLYLTVAVDAGHAELKAFEKMHLHNPSQMYSDALRIIGWTEGAAVRIPLNVPLYSIVRLSEVSPQRKLESLDSRRLDHKGMP